MDGANHSRNQARKTVLTTSVQGFSGLQQNTCNLEKLVLDLRTTDNKKASHTREGDKQGARVK
jgi:hypothetical protein